jgi:hypothetical protein
MAHRHYDLSIHLSFQADEEAVAEDTQIDKMIETMEDIANDDNFKIKSRGFSMHESEIYTED